MEDRVRYINPSQFLTKTEMVRALTMFAEAHVQGRNDFAQRFADEVILPNLSRIRESLGLPVNAGYLAQAVEAAIGEALIEVLVANTERVM